MSKSIHIGVILCLFTSGLGRGSTEFVRIERLSERVILGYWLGTGRCNLVAVKSQKGLTIIDTEMSPRIMAPIKEGLEKTFGRDDWAYVINTHAHMHHAGGNCLFKDAVIVGHDKLQQGGMCWAHYEIRYEIRENHPAVPARCDASR